MLARRVPRWWRAAPAATGRRGSPTAARLSPSEGGQTAGPLIGASHALLPAPGADGVLLLTAPPEEAADDWAAATVALGRCRLVQARGSRTGADGAAATSRPRTTRSATSSWSTAARTRMGSPTRPGSGTARPGAGPRRAHRVPGCRPRWPGTPPAARWCSTAATVRMLSPARSGTTPGRGTATCGPGCPRAVRSPAAGRRRRSPATRGRSWSTAGIRWSTTNLPPALGDTWVWADGAWTLADDAGGPGPLVNAQALVHPTLGTLLAGGSDLERETGDVWRWTGDSWETYAREVLPPRQAFGMAYDEARGVVVLTGGVVEPGRHGSSPGRVGVVGRSRGSRGPGRRPPAGLTAQSGGQTSGDAAATSARRAGAAQRQQRGAAGLGLEGGQRAAVVLERERRRSPGPAGPARRAPRSAAARRAARRARGRWRRFISRSATSGRQRATSSAASASAASSSARAQRPVGLAHVGQLAALGGHDRPGDRRAHPVRHQPVQARSPPRRARPRPRRPRGPRR